MKILSLTVFYLLSWHFLFSQKLSEIIQYQWKDGNWVVYSEQSYDYNKNGTVQKSEVQRWDGFSDWENSSMMNYAYNNRNEKMENYTIQSWNAHSNQWGNFQSVQFEYVANQLSTIIYKYWKDNDWQNITKQIKFYNEDGKNIRNLTENWDEKIQNWSKSSQLLNDYSANGMISYHLSQDWSVENEQWINVQQVFYYYDDNKNVIGMLYQRWVNGNWENQMQQTNVYDENSDLKQNLIEVWNTSSKSWVSDMQTNYEYLAPQKLNRYITQKWNLTSNNWNNYMSAKATYRLDFEDDNKEEVDFQIYPNPTQDFLNVLVAYPQKTQIQILDTQGKVLISKGGVGQQIKIDVKSLVNGVYILQVVQGKKISTAQWVKK